MHVHVAPAAPLRRGEGPEKRVRLHALFAEEALQESKQRILVPLELLRGSSALLLIHLREGANSFGRRQWSVEDDPFQYMPMNESSAYDGRLLSQRETESVGEMTDHLVRIHLAPAARSLCTNAVETTQKSAARLRVHEVRHGHRSDEWMIS